MATTTPTSTRASVVTEATNDERPWRFVPRNSFVARMQREQTRLPKFVVFNVGPTTGREFYRIIRTCLSEDWCKGISSVSRVEGKRGRPRLIIDVKPELAELLKRGLREATRDSNPRFRGLVRGAARDFGVLRNMPSNWRLQEYKPFKDRERSNLTPPPIGAHANILTWNVNGFASKYVEIEDALHREHIGVAMLQETLQNSARRPLRVKGYTTYSIDWEEGFRGQAILVDDRLPAYRVPHAEPQILHVKISQWKMENMAPIAIHVFSLYCPSGGNHRRDRGVLFARLEAIVREIFSADKDARVILGGDWNEDATVLKGRLLGNPDFGVLDMKGSSYTRYPKRGNRSAIDHFLASDNVQRYFKKPRVLRRYCISDHRPVLLKAKSALEPGPAPVRRPGIDNAALNERRQRIVSHNMWKLFENDGENETLETLVNSFNESMDKVLRHPKVLVKYNPSDQRPKPQLPKKLKRLLTKTKKLAKKVAIGVMAGENVEVLESEWRRARKEFRSLNGDVEHTASVRSYTRIGENLLSGDFKSAWSRLNAKTNRESVDGKGMPLKPGQPMRDKEGVLHSDPVEVSRIMTNHYKSLHQDLPAQTWRREAYWEATIPELVDNERDESADCVPIRFPEIIGSIRALNRDTAPGYDEVHVNTLKVLVREESMEQLKAMLPDRTRWDQIQVDLRLDQFPEDPHTRFGKALWPIFKRVWDTAEMPSAWHENVVISLYKDGEPDLPTNYRGVTLISVLQKVLCGVIMRRMYQHMAAEDLLDEAQAGFRPGEEAIAHLTALAEIVRRRFLMDRKVRGTSPTYAAFIDLKKAFDKVPHELIFRVLKTQGFPIKLMNLIRAIYETTKIRVRAGGIDSDAYELWRGLRQGCLLSPILFIIFVHSLLEYVNGKAEQEGGVGTPLRSLNAMSAGICHGLLYADDIAALQDALPKMQAFLRAFVEWCKYWGMEVGLKKCGVTVWTDSTLIRDQFNATVFDTPIGVFPKVDWYKYLGITVDETLPYSREAIVGTRVNETSYVLSLAEKGTRTLHLLRPALTDPNCPISIKIMLIRTFLQPVMLYGGEWLGFRQLNSDPLQRVLDTAMHWAVGLKGKSNLVNSKVLSVELNIPLMEEELAAARARLYLKARKTTKGGTWLSKLCQTTKKTGREETWVFGSKKALGQLLQERNKYSKDDDTDWLRSSYKDTRGKDVPLRPWALVGQILEHEVKSNKFRSEWLQDLREDLARVTKLDKDVVDEELVVNLTRDALENAVDNFDPAYERFMMLEAVYGGSKGRARWETERILLVREIVRERAWSTKKTSESSSFAFYDRFGFGATRGFLRQTIRRTNLREGVRYLVAVRARFLPRVLLNWQWAKAAGRPCRDEDRNLCPLCDAEIVDGWDFAHLMLGCENEDICRYRDRYLAKPLSLVENECWAQDIIQDVQIEDAGMDAHEAALAVMLAGGTVRGHFGSSFTLGYGAADILPLGMSTPGYVPVAEFLQIAVPKWLDSLSNRFGSATARVMEVAIPVAEGDEGG